MFSSKTKSNGRRMCMLCGTSTACKALSCGAFFACRRVSVCTRCLVNGRVGVGTEVKVRELVAK